MSIARSILLGTPARRRMTLLAFGVLFAVVGVELLCQGAFLAIAANWRKTRTEHMFYFARSDNPVLAYRLMPGCELSIENRRLKINSRSIRDDADDPPPGARKVAVLGDSVVFGFALDQDETIPACLQRMLDPTAQRVKVLNFGTPGYALREYDESLRELDAVYRVDAVVCVLNPNDFTLRDTMYEGGDNGLNKMFRRPVLMSPYFFSKLVYRMNKGADFPGLGWYQWIFRGTASRNLPYFISMRDYCRARGIPFKVVIMPSSRVWREGRYGLADEVRRISEFLAAAEIPYTFPVDRFGGPADPNNGTMFYDHTDHFTPRGCEEMARVIAELLGRDSAFGPGEPGTAGTHNN